MVRGFVIFYFYITISQVVRGGVQVNRDEVIEEKGPLFEVNYHSILLSLWLKLKITKREAKFTSLYDLHITFTFLCYFSTMKVGFDCMGQVNCFVRKGTGTILSSLLLLNLGKCLAEGEVTVKIASFIKIDIWFELKTGPLCM